MKLYIIAIFALFVLACHNNLEPIKSNCLTKLTSLIKIPKGEKFTYNDDWRVTIDDNEYQIMEVLTYNNCCLDSVYIVKSEGTLEYDLQLIQSDSLLNNSYLDKKIKNNIIGKDNIIDKTDTLHIVFNTDNRYIVNNKFGKFFLYEIEYH